jgi:Fe-S oxidoreductase
LREIYQTEDIVQICEECGSDINKQLSKIQDKCWSGKIEVEDISKELKEFMVKWKVWEGRFC